jgi:hypothetical protein
VNPTARIKALIAEPPISGVVTHYANGIATLATPKGVMQVASAQALAIGERVSVQNGIAHAVQAGGAVFYV